MPIHEETNQGTLEEYLASKFLQRCHVLPFSLLRKIHDVALGRVHQYSIFGKEHHPKQPSDVLSSREKDSPERDVKKSHPPSLHDAAWFPWLYEFLNILGVWVFVYLWLVKVREIWAGEFTAEWLLPSKNMGVFRLFGGTLVENDSRKP